VGRILSHFLPLNCLCHFVASHVPCATLMQVFVIDASLPEDFSLIAVFDHVVL